MSGVEPERDRLAAMGIARICAGNASPMTLSGTNAWMIGRDPAYLIDPGPDAAGHVDALAALAQKRGGLGAIVLTHDHPDHAAAVQSLQKRLPEPAPLAAGRGEVDIPLADGMQIGPLRAIATPGHAPDHFSLVADAARAACFTGDAVLGEGSVFLAGEPGALRGYLDALARLQELPLQVLCPGHGPAVWEPRRLLREYVEHRLQRERRLLAALDAGARSAEQMLDAAWSDVPAQMRPLAAVTLRAHLHKLAEEDRLPADVRATVLRA